MTPALLSEIAALREVAEVAEDYLTVLREDHPNYPLPGEVDTLIESLAKLKRLYAGEKS